MFIDEFTEEQQWVIYEAEYDEHCRSVSNFFGESVADICIHKAATNTKLQGFDMTVRRTAGGMAIIELSESTPSVEPLQMAFGWSDYPWQVWGYAFDTDGLLSEPFKHRRLVYLTSQLGMTLHEAMIFMSVVRNIGGMRFKVSEHGLEFDSHNHLDLTDPMSCTDLVVSLREDGAQPLAEVDSHFVDGVDPLHDLELDVPELAALLHAAVQRVADVITDHTDEVDRAVEDEWEYQTGFNAWLEHVDCMRIEFDPYDYNITIEEETTA